MQRTLSSPIKKYGDWTGSSTNLLRSFSCTSLQLNVIAVGMFIVSSPDIYVSDNQEVTHGQPGFSLTRKSWVREILDNQVCPRPGGRPSPLDLFHSCLHTNHGHILTQKIASVFVFTSQGVTVSNSYIYYASEIPKN